MPWPMACRRRHCRSSHSRRDCRRASADHSRSPGRHVPWRRSRSRRRRRTSLGPSDAAIIAARVHAGHYQRQIVRFINATVICLWLCPTPSSPCRCRLPVCGPVTWSAHGATSIALSSVRGRCPGRLFTWRAPGFTHATMSLVGGYWAWSIRMRWIPARTMCGPIGPRLSSSRRASRRRHAGSKAQTQARRVNRSLDQRHWLVVSAGLLCSIWRAILNHHTPLNHGAHHGMISVISHDDSDGADVAISGGIRDSISERESRFGPRPVQIRNVDTDVIDHREAVVLKVEKISGHFIDQLIRDAISMRHERANGLTPVNRQRNSRANCTKSHGWLQNAFALRQVKQTVRRWA